MYAWSCTHEHRVLRLPGCSSALTRCAARVPAATCAAPLMSTAIAVPLRSHKSPGSGYGLIGLVWIRTHDQAAFVCFAA